MVATAFLLQLLAAILVAAGNQQLSLLPPNYSPSGLHSPLALILKAFALDASGSCARVCLGVGSCSQEAMRRSDQQLDLAVAFTNAEQVLDCAWILVVSCVLLCRIVGGRR